MNDQLQINISELMAIAQCGYEIYSEALDMPPWENLSDFSRETWTEIAKAMVHYAVLLDKQEPTTLPEDQT